MIKANELRVGNQLYSNGIIVTIDARSIFDIWDESKEYNPIPLTPEILEKCGFVNQKNHSSWKWQKRIKRTVFNVCVYDIGCRYLDTQGCTQFIPFHYLHQLQNLYFALTGEELEVNLSLVNVMLKGQHPV